MKFPFGEKHAMHASPGLPRPLQAVFLLPFALRLLAKERGSSVNSFVSILLKNMFNGTNMQKEKMLVIIDSLKVYFDQQEQQPNILFIKGLAKYAKQMGKNCLSVLGDLGVYRHKSKFNDLMDYELSLPSKFDVDIKGFCLYHQKDFDKFSDEQKQQLIEHHSKTLEIE